MMRTNHHSLGGEVTYPELGLFNQYANLTVGVLN